MGRARALQVVELTDEGEPGGYAAPRIRGATEGAERRAGRHAGLGLVVVGLVVGALMAGQGVLDLRHREHVARVAALPGAVAALPDEPAVRWSAGAEVIDALLLEQPVEADGPAFVGAVPRGDGSVDVVALDAGTGEVRWALALEPRPGEVAQVGSRRSACVLSGARRLLTCLVAYRDSATSPLAAPARAEVVVVTTASGAVRARYAVPPQTDRVAVVGGTLAYAWRVLGAVELRARDLLTGAARWRTTLAVPRSGTPDLGATSGAPRLGRVQLAATAGLFVVSAGPQTAVLSPDGVTQPATSGRARYVRESSARRLVLLEPAADGLRSVVVRSRVDVRRLPGAVALPSLDDGSARAVLTVDDGLRARAPDGRVLWAVPGRTSGLVVLDDVAYQATDRDLLRAVDVATGGVLWRVAGPPGQYATGLVTDGERLYVELRGGVAGPALAAYTLDGRHAADVRAPTGWVGVERRGDVVLSTSADGLRRAVLG